MTPQFVAAGQDPRLQSAPLNIQAAFFEDGRVRLDLSALSALPVFEVDVYADTGTAPDARRTGPGQRRNRAVGPGQIGALGPGFGPSWYERTPYWVQVSARQDTGWCVWQGSVTPQAVASDGRPAALQVIVLRPLPAGG